jgi:serine/threonine protein kinase/formylglycine-generating enzyme required for sulfatase activity
MSSDPSASPPVTPPPAGGTRPAAPVPTSRDRFPFLDPPQQPDEIGRLPGYRVLTVLGEGGMGVVFRAHDSGADRPVAIKVVKPSHGVTEADLAAAEVVRRRFAREAWAAAQLQHDHIVTVFFVGEHNGAPYVVMPLLKGESLHNRLRRGRLTVGEACRIARGAAEGLAAAHHEGLIHRDVKPGNLWLEGQRGRVKILDFGLARSTDDTTLTVSGAVLGTPAYMAPEQARDAKSVDARADLFALGCVLYEMLAGRPPFTGNGQIAVLSAVLLDEPTPLGDVNPDVPPALADLTHRLMAKGPDDRPESAVSVAEALQAWETPAAAPTPLTPTSTPVGPLRNASGSNADTLVLSPSAVTPRRRGVGVFLGLAGLAVVAWATAISLFVAAPPLSDNTVTSRPAPPAPKPEPPPAPPTKPADPPPTKSAAPPPMATHLAPPTTAAAPAAKPHEPEPTPAPKPPAPPSVVSPMRPKPLDCTRVAGVSREDVQRAQRAWAAYLGTPVEVSDDLGGVWMEFVLVPPGRFLMGSPKGEMSRLSHEMQHEVELTKPFYLGKYEVTQQQFQRVTGTNPSDFAATGRRKDKVKGRDTSRFPVEMVSWDQAADCANLLTRLSKEGHTYRLPTEAEWEYACRGGRPASQPFGVGDGHSLASTHANFNGDRPYGGAAKGPHLEWTCPAGSFPANALGLYDMHGNVREWCADWYDHYLEGKVIDPSGPLGGTIRVCRGGGWVDDGGGCRSADRLGVWLGVRHYNYGFRLARSVPSGPGK